MVTGGRSDQFEYNTQTFVFDTWKQEWIVANIESLPHRIEHRSVRVGSQIVCVGGRDISNRHWPPKAIHMNHLIPAWDRIKDFVLLRQLVENDRAVPVTLCKQVENETDNSCSDVVLQTLIIEFPLDVMRNVLTFLINPALRNFWELR